MPVLESERIVLRHLTVSDVTQRYVDWLNDPEVNRFLAIRTVQQNIDMVRDYVNSFENADNKLLLGVFDIKNSSHIGNITFSPIDWKNKVGVIGIAIGDKNYWGKGYALEALLLAINFAFSQLKIHRLDAWISVNNMPSQKLFKRAGFNQEGILKDRVKFENGYVDAYILGLVNSNE